MGLVTTVARRSLLQRPGRTLFSILGVAVGIATVVAIFTLDHNTILSRTMPVSEDWRADIEAHPKKGVQNPRESLGNIEGVEGLSAFFQNDVLFGTGDRDGGRPAGRSLIKLVALEADTARALGAYHIFAGRDLSPNSSQPELLIGRDLAERYGLEPGETVRLSQPPRMPRRVCIEGQIREEGEPPPAAVPHPFVVAGILERENLGRRAGGEVVVVDYPHATRLYEGAWVQPSFWIKRDPTTDVEGLQERLSENFATSTNRRTIVGQESDERAFRNGVRLAGLMAMVLGLFVIFHTLSMSLLERVREVAVLHSLGTTRRQIAKVFFGEALFIAGVAGAFGLAGGLLLARLMLQRGITTLGVGGRVNVFEVPWLEVGPLVATGVGIALAGSIFPLLKAQGTDTVSALRGDDLGSTSTMTRSFHIFAVVLLAVVLPGIYLVISPVVGETDRELIGVVLAGLGVLGLLVGVPLLAPSMVSWACRLAALPFERRWPLAGKLAASTIQQSPSRIAASVAAIALVSAAFVGLKGMTNSLRAETEVWAEEAVAGKVWVKGLPNVEFDALAAKLHEVPGVLGVEPSDYRNSAAWQAIGVRPDELARYGPCSIDPALLALMRDHHSVILSRRLANNLKKGVGDELYVHTPGSGTQSFEVVAVSDAYGYSPHPDERMYGVVSDEWLRRYFCIDTSTCQRVAVKMEDPRDSALVDQRLMELFPEQADISVEPGEWILQAHLHDIGRDFFLFDIIFGLTALLAGLGVLNGQLLAAMERAKELGVMRALGMTRRQVAGMVCLESSLVGVSGGLLGLAVGGALTPVIVQALQVISHLPLPHRSAGAYLGLCLIGALGVALLAGLYPIWRMSRLDAVRAVRTG